MSLSTTDTTVKTEHVVPTVIKKEPNSDAKGHKLYGRLQATRSVKAGTSHDSEVIEILSDSEDEQSVHAKEEERPTSIRKEQTQASLPGLPFDPSMFTEESGTVWTDSDLTSFALEGAFQVTKELRVDRVEYLTDIPNVWPIPKIPTSFILDLRDDEKYLVHKKPGSNYSQIRTLATPDFLIKNKVSIFRCSST